ncbi:MAG: hypothetical protein KGJ80_15110 [Chloroflexota bacterium]|nr:hypothetical protein [Chloroflexota bacterium]
MNLRHSRRARFLLAGFAGALFVAALVVFNAQGSAPAGYPPVKQTYEASVDQTRAAALRLPQPPPRTLLPTAETSAAGIPRKASGAGWLVEDFAAPFPAMSHVITSMWYEETGGKRVVVYAGALRDQPAVSPSASQGVVIVVVQSLEGGVLPGGGTYLAPGKTGPLHIVSANDVRLVLQSESSAMLYFDVSGRQFVASP